MDRKRVEGPMVDVMPDDARALDAEGDRSRGSELDRAGSGKIAMYVLLPPVLGVFLAAIFLTGMSTVPWVLGLSIIVGGICFLLASPLARRSDGLRKAGYRRAAELVILIGFTAGAVVAYTLVVYLLLGFRRPWAAELLGLVGG